MTLAPAGSRLHRLASRPSPPTAATSRPERCDLCAAPVAPEHRHLLDLGARTVQCACRACATLFDHHEAGGRRYRLIPRRLRRLAAMELSDGVWDALEVPVALAFFVRVTDLDRVVAYCPSPLGVITARVDPATWTRLVAANAALADLVADVEALLVNRMRDAREHWLAPIDVCYRLTAVVRARWKGLAGGRAVWSEIDHFFQDLAEKGQH
jgi:hypothetical protein